MIGLHRLEGIDPWAIVAHFMGVSLLFGLGCVFLPGAGPPALSVPEVGALPLLLGVGVTATAGQLLLTRAFVAGCPARVSAVGLSQVVFAMALDVLLWGRSFSPVTLLGTALVLLPAAWVVARPGQGQPFQEEKVGGPGMLMKAAGETPECRPAAGESR